VIDLPFNWVLTEVVRPGAYLWVPTTSHGPVEVVVIATELAGEDPTTSTTASGSSSFHGANAAARADAKPDLPELGHHVARRGHRVPATSLRVRWWLCR
jgi:hypothetical protein